MISTEDLKKEIEQLDSSCLDLVYQLLQQLPHKKNTKPKINPMNFSRPIEFTESSSDSDLAYTDIEDAAKYGKQLRASAWNRQHQND